MLKGSAGQPEIGRRLLALEQNPARRVMRRRLKHLGFSRSRWAWPDELDSLICMIQCWILIVLVIASRPERPEMAIFHWSYAKAR